MAEFSRKKKVCIVGSGNWGSAIARIIGANCAKEEEFDDIVNMWVYEEMVNGEKLTEIINSKHENVKYLPGISLPANVLAVPDVIEASKDADVLVFVVPHQFVRGVCTQMAGKIRSTAVGLSLIKGFDEPNQGIDSPVPTPGGTASGTGAADQTTTLDLISKLITRLLNIPVSVLMGANLAPEVAREKFCETTIGCSDPEVGSMLKRLCQASYFRVTVVPDVHTVEICGALKNIVAVGAGFVDGLEYGDNTKAAIIRLGLMEMVKFGETFYNGCNISTYLESCGVADLITTCYGGRNRRCAEAYVRTGKSIDEIEREMLNGQKLQGPATAREIHHMLQGIGQADRFPLFTAIYRICYEKLPPSEMIECLKTHPEHM